MSSKFNNLYKDITETLGDIQIDLNKEPMYTKVTDRAVFTASWRNLEENSIVRVNIRMLNKEDQELLENLPISFIDNNENIFSVFLNKSGLGSITLPQEVYHIRFWKVYEKEIDELYNIIKSRLRRKKTGFEYQRPSKIYALENAVGKPIEKEYKYIKDRYKEKVEMTKPGTYIKIGTELYSLGHVTETGKLEKLNKLKNLKYSNKVTKKTAYEIYDLKEKDKIWKIR